MKTRSYATKLNENQNVRKHQPQICDQWKIIAITKGCTLSGVNKRSRQDPRQTNYSLSRKMANKLSDGQSTWARRVNCCLRIAFIQYAWFSDERESFRIGPLQWFDHPRRIGPRMYNISEPVLAVSVKKPEYHQPRLPKRKKQALVKEVMKKSKAYLQNFR